MKGLKPTDMPQVTQAKKRAALVFGSPEPGSGAPLFPRDRQAAAASADAIMEAARAFGRPNGAKRPQSARAPRAWRVAALAAAAVALIALSSTLTATLLRPLDVVEVRFTLEAPEASSVVLAADFNGWSPEGYELTRSAHDGTWSIVVPLRKGRAYTYNFIIDGERWVADPNAPMLLDDGFGGSMSSLAL
ncbi:MAG: isoamylase early set domain-containing protein [Spirochaetia bacterium]|nr:isoamylase early set domain-containing protein [Spirochaetia bacterium]